MASLFEIPIGELKGIGSKKAQLYNKLGISTIGDLLRYYPRSYEDWSNPVPIADAVIGNTCVVKATLCAMVSESYIPGGRLVSKVTVIDDTGALTLVFFNNKYIKSMLKLNTEYYFYGKLSYGNGKKEMISPSFLVVGEQCCIRPVYGQTAGVTSRQIEANVKQAFNMLPPKIKEPIPHFIMEKYKLCSLEFALENIHFPKSEDNIQQARKRLVFEELLILNLGLRKLKSGNKAEKSTQMAIDYTEEFFKLLPFTPTDAQLRATKECVADMQHSKSPMNRLVQGDVGSGKTAVAAALCYSATKNGWQCAFMAPTEILAEQHYNNISEILNGTGVTVQLLTGSVTAANKRKIKEKLISGETNIVIGTHALISDTVEFLSLGLVITDEQHRFGVAQRAKLLSKGNNPHLLVMSATPIPRTLALMVYGDLDVSVIDQLPPGRQKIETFFVNSGKRARMYGFLKQHIDCGRQVYIVCPLVEDSGLNLTAVESYKENIEKNYFKNYSVGLLHGKMKAKDKERVMSSFKQGEINILVSTTVIEVGVDVPNATIMVIENAERFGLSQLHQLRGRVGRGKHKSYCILVSDTKSEVSKERLSVMCKTNNGFEIADFDLAQRGPGDFFGNRQHGLPEMKIANLADTENVAYANAAAEEILEKSSDLSADGYRGLGAEVKRLFGHVENGLN